MDRTVLKKIVICLLVASFYYISYAAAEEMSTSFDVTPVIRKPYLNPDDKGAEIEFVLQNKQASAVDNVRVYLFLQPPFSASYRSALQEEMNLDYIVGTGVNEDVHTQGFVLGEGQTSKTRFKIDVDKNAKYGNYELPYTIYYNYNGVKTYSNKIKLHIAGTTLIEIADVMMDKKEIKPGDNFQISVSLRNAGDNEIKWVKIALNSQNAQIIPLSSASEKVFNDMSSNIIYSASFDFTTDKGMSPKNYPMTVSLNYQDENGRIFNETKNIGVKVIDNSNLDIASITIDPQRIYAGEDAVLTIRMENNGQGDAKSVKAEIDIPLKGEKTAFLGTIKPDEDAPAVYVFKTENSGEINYTLKITYKDDRGEHVKEQPLTLVVYPRNSNNTPFLFLGALVIPAYLYWRKIYRKPHQPVE